MPGRDTAENERGTWGIRQYTPAWIIEFFVLYKRQYLQYMFALVYRSKAVPGFGRLQIQEMLLKARRYNESQGITGCLLYHDGEFLQYLEGNQIRVLKLYDKIKADPRHTNMELLSYGNRPQRRFEQWEMAYEDFYGDNDQIAYMKLLVEEHLETLGQETSDPAVNTFWKNVSTMLRGDFQASE